MPDRLRLISDESKLTINDDDGCKIIIKAAEKDKNSKDKKIKDAGKLSIIGGSYSKKEDAKNASETAFAYMGLAADFGDRAPRGSWFTDIGLKMVEGKGKKKVLNDVHGLMVYKTDPELLFVKFSADAVAGIPAKKTIDMLKLSFGKGTSNNMEEQVAYDLYATSFFLPATDARFLTLMMAIETLAERQDREASAIRHAENLIDKTRQSNLSEEEKNSMISSLKDLKKQSVSEACKNLVKPLNKKYLDLDSSVFVSECYKLRSKLVHGDSPRPSREDVEKLVAGLEILVSHTLSLKLGEPFRETGVTS